MTGKVSRLLRGMAAGAVAALALAGLGAPRAQAQVAALVNGEPITEFDIGQRTRLIYLSTRKTPSRQEALDDLIDDKLKLSIAKRYTIDIKDREVDSTFANIARRTGASSQQFAQMLAQAGISATSFKARLKSDIAWQNIVRGKFQSSFQVGERDVAAALQTKEGQSEELAFEYRLRPILLVVPRGSPPAAYEARRKDAEALRARFQSCDEGIAIARGMRDSAVRDQVVRLSSDLGQQQREALTQTPVGKLTPAETTAQGIEIFAVCGKEQVRGSESPNKREARDKIMNQRYQAVSKRYLQELRRGAMIEIR